MVYLVEMHDLEAGAVTKLERVVMFIAGVMKHKRSLLIFVSLWIGYVAMCFGASTVVDMAANTTLPRIEVPRIIPVVELPSFAIDLETNAEKRYLEVLNNVNKYEIMTSALYEFNQRHFRNHLSLEQIQRILRELASAREFFCLSAIHVGIPLRIMVLDGNLMINPKLLGHANDIVEVEEESAFYQHTVVKKRRYKTIEIQYFTGNQVEQIEIFENMKAVCVQHCIDAMDAVPFITNDEL